MSGLGRYGLPRLNQLGSQDAKATGHRCPVWPSSPVKGAPLLIPWYDRGKRDPGGDRGCFAVSDLDGISYEEANYFMFV
jgi:hypothetical protein